MSSSQLFSRLIISLLFTIIIQTVYCEDISDCGTNNIQYSLKVIDSPPQQIIFSDDGKVVFALTESGSLYKSTDGGVSWENQDKYLKQTINTGILTFKIRKIIKTQISGKIYILGSSAVYWTNVPGTNSYNVYYRYFLDIKPNEQFGDYALAVDSANCTMVKCAVSLYATEDFGVSWSKIKDYVYTWDWGSGTTVYVISVSDDKATGNQFSIPIYYRRLYISNNLGDTFEYESPEGYTNFYYSNSILYATEMKSQTTDSGMQLLVSSDGGATFNIATFIDPLLGSMPTVESAYQILDNSELSTFINVQLTSDMRYGAIYESDTYEADFWISLRYNRIDATNKLADFVKYNGLNGIYYANRYNVSNLTPVNNLDPYIETVVSFDKGGVWSRMGVSENSSCSDSNCALHLYGPVDQHLPQLLSSPSAVGLLLATGNEGVYRSVRSSTSATYLSRNMGYSWFKIRDGINKYAMGDHGGLLFLSSVDVATQTITYSWDQGISWSECMFSDATWDIHEIYSVGGPTSTKFLVVSSNSENEGALIHFDLSNTMATPCEGADTPGEAGSDYEVFTPEADGVCLLGRKESYVRRKRESLCYNGEEFDRTIYDIVNCPCRREDYVCDGDCFEEMKNSTSGETVCYNVCANSDNDPQVAPENCTGVILITQGYQLIDGDTCIGGLNLSPLPYNCSPDDSGTDTPVSSLDYSDSFISLLFLLITFLCILCIALVAVVFIIYRKNERVYNLLNPYIPSWCIKKDENEDDIYGSIDPTSGNSLLDEEIFDN